MVVKEEVDCSILGSSLSKRMKYFQEAVYLVKHLLQVGVEDYLELVEVLECSLEYPPLLHCSVIILQPYLRNLHSNSINQQSKSRMMKTKRMGQVKVMVVQKHSRNLLGILLRLPKRMLTTRYSLYLYIINCILEIC